MLLLWYEKRAHPFGWRSLFGSFVAEKIRLGRETSWIFRTLVDVPPAHAGLLRKSPVWIVAQAGPFHLLVDVPPAHAGLLLVDASKTVGVHGYSLTARSAERGAGDQPLPSSSS